MRLILIPTLVLLTLSACGGGGDSSVTVYKSRGTVNCGGAGLTITMLERQLADAGVKVNGSSCGTDGLSHPAACDVADGRIGIFYVPENQLAAATAAGFTSVSALPTWKKTPW